MNANVITMKKEELSGKMESSVNLRFMDKVDFLKEERFGGFEKFRATDVSIGECEVGYEVDDRDSEFSIFLNLKECRLRTLDLERCHVDFNKLLDSEFRDVHKLRHELVSMVFSKTLLGTDKQLLTQTPDDWIIVNEQLRVIDFKTKASAEYNVCEFEVDKAVIKYSTNSLKFQKEMSLEDNVVHSVCVGNGILSSSFELTTDEIHDVFMMWHIGEMLSNVIIGMGYRPDWLEDEAVFVDSLKDNFKSLIPSNDYDEDDDVEDKIVNQEERVKGMINAELLDRFSWPISNEFGKEIKDCFDRSFQESTSWVENMMKHRETDERKYKESMREGILNEKGDQDRRSDKKTIVQIPLPSLEVKCDMSDKDFYMAQGFSRTESPLINMWKNAGRSRYDKSSLTEGWSDELFILKAYSKDGLINKSRNKNYKADVELRTFQSSEVHETGIKLKKHSRTLLEKASYAKSKLPFSYDTDVSDVTDFITSNNLVSNFKTDCNITAEKMLDFEQFDPASKFKMEGIDSKHLMSQYSGTKVARSLSFLTSLMLELNNSLNSRPGRFYLKRIPNFNAWVLIRLVSKDKPLQFSLCCKESDYSDLDGSMSRVFLKPEVKKYGMVYYKFVTIERHRISHYIPAFQMGFAMTCMMIELFGEPISKMFSWQLSRKTQNHSLFAILAYLEDKQQTSADLQLARFAYMECLTCEIRSPLKIVNKLDFRPKSRLLVWIHKRFYECFKRMSYSVPKYVLSNDKRTGVETRYDNLISFIDLKEIETARVAINLSYLGVLHNRDEGDQTHGEMAILQKMIKLEVQMRESRLSHLGYKQLSKPEELGVHEFSPDHIKAYSLALKNHLDKKFPGGYRQRHLQRMTKQSHKRTLSFLATFKSSAEVSDPDAFTLPPNERTKVINQLIKWYKDDLALLSKVKATQKPLFQINELINSINDRSKLKGIYTGIFRKLQIGGPREIFILDVVSRIVVHWLETNCRMVCKDSDNEMLTDKNKHSVSEKHARVVSAKVSEGYVEITTMESADASKWSQSFVMPAFACFVKNFFDDDIADVMINILHLVSKKHIELPKNVIEQFIKNPAKETFNEELDELRKQFFGEGEGDLLKKSKYHMQNISNMMQGILHYLSSLLHSAKQHFVEMSCKSYLEKKLEKMKPIVLITNKVSSDDSSTIRTTLFPRSIFENLTDEERLMIIYTHRACSIFETKLYSTFCASLSREKTTACVASDVEEFNSVWNIQGHQISPKLKFIMPALRMTLNSSIVKRLITFSNLRRQMKASGCSSWMCSMVEECQRLCHYDALGARTNTRFHIFLQHLKITPHPCFGLFLREVDVSCGIMGYDMAEYLATRNFPSVRSVAGWIYDQKDLEVLEFGKRSMNVEFKMGDTKNYWRNVNKLGLDKKKWAEENDNLSTLRVLLDKASNIEEEYFLMQKKYFGPSASDSFTFDMAGKMYAASTYIMQTNCITVGERVKEGWETKKVSLLKAMSICAENLKEMTMDEVDSVFPYYRLYKDFNIILESTGSLIRMKDKDFTSRKLKIYFPIDDEFTKVSMRKSLLNLWFGEKSEFSGTEHKEAISIYKSKYTWIRDTAEETLKVETCPVSTYVGLGDFAMSVEVKPKLVEATAIVSASVGNKRVLEDLLRKDCFPGYILSRGDVEAELDQAGKISIELSSVLNDWRDRKWKVDRVKSALQKFEKPDDLNRLNNLEMTIYALRLALESKDFESRSKVVKMIESLKGVVGYYSEEQKKDGFGMWKGKGTFLGRIDGVTFRLRMRDDVATLIEIDNYNNLSKIAQPLSRFIRAIRLSEPGEWSKTVLTAGVVKSSSNGIKVRWVNSLRSLDFSMTNHNLKVTIDGHRLLLDVGFKRANYTMLSFVPRVWKVQRLNDEEDYTRASKFTDSFWNGWKSSSVEGMNYLLMNISDSLKLRNIDVGELAFDSNGKQKKLYKGPVGELTRFVCWIKDQIERRAGYDYDLDFIERTGEVQTVVIDLMAVAEATEKSLNRNVTSLDIMDVAEKSPMISNEPVSVDFRSRLAREHPMLDNLFSNMEASIRLHLEGQIIISSPEFMRVYFPVTFKTTKTMQSDAEDLI